MKAKGRNGVFGIRIPLRPRLLLTAVAVAGTALFGVGGSPLASQSPTLSIDDVTQAEGNTGNTVFTFTVTLSEPSTKSVKVNYEAVNGSATLGSDFNPANASVTFDPGLTTMPVTVVVRGDTDYEPDETFFVKLSNPRFATIADGQGRGTIVNDDQPIPGLSINDVTVEEGNGGTTPAVFTVSLTFPAITDVTFDIATQDGSATAPSDYVAKPPTSQTIPAGQQTYSFTVEVNGDNAFEPAEQFFVNVTNPSAGAMIADDQGIGTIANDDDGTGGLPTLSISDPSAEEGDAGTTPFEFVVSLSAPSQQQVKVNFATANGTANALEDYQPTNGQLLFKKNQTEKTITVLVKGDTNDEPDETFYVNLSNPQNATLAQGQALGTIIDDDDDPPVAVDDAATVAEDAAATAIDVLANDTDTDGGPKFVASVGQPTNGTVVITNAGADLTYEPDADYCNDGTPTDDFSYSLNGGSTATVAVTVTCVNDLPVAGDDSYSTDEDVLLSVAAPGVLGNDSDVDGDSLAAVLVSGPSQASSFTLNADGSFSYTPAADFHGVDSFTYKPNDGTADGNTATVTLTVNPVNDAPVANDDTYVADAGGAASAAAPGVLGNDTDVDGDSLSAVLVSGPSKADSFTLNADGSFSYQASSGASGSDSFTYRANDGTVDSTLATVTITLNTPPVANDDAYAVAEDATLTADGVGGNPNGVLANDFDGDGDPLTASLVGDVANGTLTPNADGTFTYTPDPDFFGEDTFTYTANDGIADSNTATVTITVTPVNDAPVLANVEAAALAFTEGDTPTAVTSTITVSDVDSANLVGATVQITSNYASGEDVLAFVNTATIVGSFNAATGTLTLSGTDTLANYQTALRSVTYANSSGSPSTATRTVSFRVDDGAAANNLSNVVTRDIAVTSVNDPPVLANVEVGALAYTENDAATAVTSTITVADSDSANPVGATVQITGNYASGEDVLGFVNQLGITGVFNAGTGTLTLSGTTTVANYQTALRAVTYQNTSDSPSTLTRTVSFQVDDGAAADNLSNTVSRDVTVTAVNDTPVATAKTLTTHSGIRVTIDGSAAGKLLEGASDPDDPASELTVSATFTDITPAGGSVELLDATTGAYRFNPPAGHSGAASFKFTVCDDGSPVAPQMCSAPATVSVSITGPDLWFVDDSAGTTGTGRLTDPFDSLSDLPAGRGNGDRIFVYSGTYTTGHALNASEHLIGQATTSTAFDSALGVQVPGNGTLDARPSLGGSAVTLQNTVTLASSGKVQGITINSGTNTGLAGAGGLTGVDVSQTSITTTTGTGISLNIVAGSLTFSSLTTNGAANGVTLTNVNASIVISGGSIAESTGADVAIIGGNGNFSYSGTITDDVGTLVLVASATGGTKTFSGAISDGNDGDGAGISLTNNTGATMTFSGGLTLSTGPNPAFTATGGGTVNVTGSGNSLDTTTGTALNVTNTTIGTGGLTFEHISSNGAANGIVLDSTGASGGLTVTGDGTNTTLGGNSSGGTIANATGADGATAGRAISLNNTRDVTLRRMTINGTNQNFGIRGTGVTNFTLEYSTVAGVNGTSTVDREGSVVFDNLFGTGAVTGSIVSGGIEDNFRVENASGTLSSFTISNSTVQNNDNVQGGICPNGCGNIGVRFATTGTASMTASILDSTFRGNRTDAINTDAGDNSTINVTISGNTIVRGTAPNAEGNIGIDATAGVDGDAIYTITNNKIGTDGITEQPLLNTGINVFAGGTTATLSAFVSGNTIVKDNTTIGTGASGTGIRVFQQDSADMAVNVVNNTISKVGLDFAIDVTDNGSGTGASTGTLQVAVRNNSASINAAAINAIRIRGRRDTNTCAVISGNSTNVNGGLQAGLSVSQANTAVYRIEGLALGSQTDATVQAFLAGQNPAATVEAFSATGTGFTGVASGTCNSIPTG